MTKSTIEKPGELYGGRVKYRFYPNSHAYYVSVDGGKFIRKRGVTGISGILDKSMALQKWQQLITAEYLLEKIESEQNIGHDEIFEAVAQCDLQKEGAADIGKAIHSWCESHILSKISGSAYPAMPENDQVLKGVEAFLAWESSLESIEYHQSERVVYSLKNDYIGTMDLDATINGRRAVGDFKSSNGLYNSIRLQTIGYADAVEEEAGEKLYKDRWGIRVSKFDEPTYYKKEERKKELKRFMARKIGREFKDYEIKPFQVFEARLLASTAKDHKIDRDGFKCALGLKDWDATTNFWQND